MSLCIGVDISTKRIDLAAIPLDPDDEFLTGVTPCKHRINVTDRYVELRQNIVRAIASLEEITGADVMTAAVEKPAGRFVHPSLHEIHGVVRCSLPQHIASTGLYPVEWRQALGLTGRDKNNKQAGNDRVRTLYSDAAAWDEHELDALGIATAWRTIQWEAAA